MSRLSLGAAGAVAALLGIAVAVTSVHGGSGRDSVIAADGSSRQIVSYRGVQVSVPSAWRPHATTQCGTPVASTYLLAEDGGSSTCFDGDRPPSHITVVWLMSLSSREGALRAQVANHSVTVSGRSAREGAGIPPGERTRYSVLVVPDNNVVISIWSDDSRLTSSILGSATAQTVDANGCAAQVDFAAAQPPPDATGASDQLVPGDPGSAALCRYTGDALVRSVPLSAPQRRSLQATLNALPSGESHDVTGHESAGECQADAQRGFVLAFGYPNGTSVEVRVHIGGCGALTASNGARTTKIDGQLVTTVTDIGGYDGGFPDPSELG